MVLHSYQNFIHVELTKQIIGAAIAVHRSLGPGFLESIYEKALIIELTQMGMSIGCQVPINIQYRGKPIGMHRLDLIVENRIVVEIKAIKEIDDVHKAVVLSYLKATSLNIGLIINFARSKIITTRLAYGLSKGNTEEQSLRGTEEDTDDDD